MTKIMLKNIKKLGKDIELGIDEHGLYVNGNVAVLGYGLIATAKAKEVGLSANEIMKKYSNHFVFIRPSIQHLFA